MTTTPTLDRILERADADQSVAAIAHDLDVSPGYVYGVLREHRPDRARKKHARSKRHYQILDMHYLHGKSVGQIASALGIKRQGVHRHLSEGNAE